MKYQDVLNGDAKFRYIMLSRLQQDCNYYLGFGGRAVKHLWASTESEHIDLMVKLWNSFSLDEKPEWISKEVIDTFKKRMCIDTSKVTIRDYLKVCGVLEGFESMLFNHEFECTMDEGWTIDPSPDKELEADYFLSLNKNEKEVYVSRHSKAFVDNYLDDVLDNWGYGILDVMIDEVQQGLIPIQY